MPAPIYVKPGEAQYAVSYETNVDPHRKAALEALWKRFTRTDPATGQSYRIWYRPTNRNLEMYVDYSMPSNAQAGRYRVEAFIPGRHATTRKGIFTIANNFHHDGGQLKYDDSLTVVDMYNLYDVWYPLGEYEFDPGANPLSGRVRQYELSLEDPPVEISFGPIRWVPLFTVQPGTTPRFDTPVGTQVERDGLLSSGQMAFGLYPVWLGNWYDANPYLSWYSYGYHTGADLNLPGSSDADKDAPIYAVADGVVVYAGQAGSWGNIIVIEHPDSVVTLHNGNVQRQRVFSRYGHVTDRILVAKDQAVLRGANIGFIGLPAGYVTGWHLHFDISYSDRLKNRPSHWPDMSRIRALQKAGVSQNSREFIEAQLAVKKEVLDHYLDPFRFLKDNHGS